MANTKYFWNKLDKKNTSFSDRKFIDASTIHRSSQSMTQTMPLLVSLEWLRITRCFQTNAGYIQHILMGFKTRFLGVGFHWHAFLGPALILFIIAQIIGGTAFPADFPTGRALPRILLNKRPRNVAGLTMNHHSLDWFKGKCTGTPYI